MIDMELFLGLPLDSHILRHLKTLSDYSRLVGCDSDYLIEIDGPTGSFIGKKIGQSIDRETLSNAEANIYSLLSKLAPDTLFKNIPLVVFPYQS